jgi:hypothetical protein
MRASAAEQDVCCPCVVLTTSHALLRAEVLLLCPALLLPPLVLLLAAVRASYSSCKLRGMATAAVDEAGKVGLLGGLIFQLLMLLTDQSDDGC